MIATLLAETDSSLPWKNEDYWVIPGGGFVRTIENGSGTFDAGPDGTCKYLWDTLRFNGVGRDAWGAFVRTIQGHSQKLRYNERKAAMSSQEVKKRREKRRERKKQVA